MRRRLLPLGLAALLCNPSFAQTAVGGHDSAYASGNFGAPSAAEPAAPLILDTALALALAGSPELSGARRELAATEATIVQAQTRPNPELATLIEDTRKETRTTTLQLNQPIELGGKRDARIEAAERGRDGAALELDAKRAEVRAAVVAAFFDVLIAQERLRLAQGSVDLAQRASGAAARRVAAGKVSPVEETKARVAEAGVRIELTQAVGELATARRRLSGTWGNPAPRFERAEGDLGALPPLPARADLYARLATSPGLLRASVEVDHRQALAELERSRRVPDLTVSLGAKRDEELKRDQVIFGLSIPIPVFDRNQGNLQEALLRTGKARDELLATRIRLSSELDLAYEQLHAAREETDSLRREILPGAQSAYEAATKGFELGKFGFLDLLDAQRTSFQAKTQYLRALAGAHRAAAEIDRILGAAPTAAVATKP